MKTSSSKLLPGYFYRLKKSLLFFNTDEENGFTQYRQIVRTEQVLFLSTTPTSHPANNKSLHNHFILKFLEVAWPPASCKIICDVVPQADLELFIEKYFALDEEIHDDLF